jgi:hypothetical protein
MQKRRETPMRPAPEQDKYVITNFPNVKKSRRKIGRAMQHETTNGRDGKPIVDIST